MSEQKHSFTRRSFLIQSGCVGAGLTLFSVLPAVRGMDAPSNRIRVGVMGTSRSNSGGDGRGTELAVGFASLPGVEVAYVCDVDERNVPKAVESVVTKGKQTKPPVGVRDFRRIVEDKSVDVLVIATPDHWHAPAAILACSAGKHVYVEKPCSHNAYEGELLVAAARKHRRLVQHGTQRRSWPALREAAEKLRSGAIGRVLFAKCLYFGPRPSIGNGKAVAAPGWLDYELWQGPAPERPYRDNLVHYNWHWFWHWGTGELGNNAVHFLDVCRWMLDLDYPLSVTSSGGKFRFPEDDQETPDTNIASFDFGSTTVTWEQRSWAPRTDQDSKADILFYGENGVLTIAGNGHTIHDLKGNKLQEHSADGGNQSHLQNLIDGIRQGTRLNAAIEDGAKSALLCHLGNIAWRTGHTIHADAKTGRIVSDKSAQALWSREYRKGWEPRV